MSLLEILGLAGKGDEAVERIVKLGYPEHTARKIASGELPMDEASRMQRAAEQSFRTAPDQRAYHGTAGDIYEWDESKLARRDAGDLGKGLYTTSSPEMAKTYAAMTAKGTGQDPNVMELMLATDAREIPMSEKMLQRTRVREGDMDTYLNEAENIKFLAGIQGKSATSAMDSFGKEFETANYDLTKVRSSDAAFDPENINSKYVRGLQGGASAAGGVGTNFVADKFVQEDYGDDTSGTTPQNPFADIQNIPKEIWDGMKMREKVALVTSMVPVVGTATGVYSDVMNMVEDEDERTLLNTLLLASNFIPGNKIAEMADKMGITDLYKKTGLGKPRTKEEVEASKVEGFGDVVQTQKKGEVQESMPMEQLTATGKVSNPLLDQLREGEYGKRVSPQQKTKLTSMAEQNPVFEQQQLARSGGTRTVSEDDLYSQSATWEQMLGRPLIMLPADMTSIRRIERIGGVDIDPFHTQGGGAHADYTGIWRSMQDAAQGKQLHANKVREATGLDPIMIYSPMAHAGSNFSTMGSEGILHYLDAVGDMTPKGKKALDDYMRGLNQNVSDYKGIPDAYPGYESPEQMLQWLSNPDMLKPGEPSLGNRRKAFMTAMANKDMMQYGAPDINDVYSAINEQALHGLPHRSSGGKAIISADVHPDDLNYNPSRHRSYDTDIPSQGALTLGNDSYVPTEIVFPDMAKARADKDPARRYRSMQVSGSKDDYQMADEQWLMGILGALKQQAGR